MEFKLSKDPVPAGPGPKQEQVNAGEQTQILDTRSGPILNLLGDSPPEPAAPAASVPWGEGFSRINMSDSMANGHVPQTAAMVKHTDSYRKKIVLGLLGVGLVLVLFAGWMIWSLAESGQDVMQELTTILDQIIGVDPNSLVVDQAPVAPRDITTRTSLEPVPPEIKPISTLNLNGQKGLNPYWGLPNEILGVKEFKIARKITSEEEVSWANALKHKFPYPRYRAVLEIRANRFAGSESLLWYAVHDQKLWIRMRAIMGLADIGQSVTVGQVKKALGNDPDERIANFFARFVKNSTEGERYIMRHAIRLVGEKSRYVILKTLEQSEDDMRNMYIAAASLDSGAHIKSWLRKTRVIFDMNGSQYEKYMAMIAKPGTNKSPVTTAKETASQSLPENAQLDPLPVLDGNPGLVDPEGGSGGGQPPVATKTEAAPEMNPDAELDADPTGDVLPATDDSSSLDGEEANMDASFDDF